MTTQPPIPPASGMLEPIDSAASPESADSPDSADSADSAESAIRPNQDGVLIIKDTEVIDATRVDPNASAQD